MRYVARTLRLGAETVSAVDLGEITRWAVTRLLAVLGVAVFLVGLVLLPLPIPLGVPFMLIGTLMVLNTSTAAKRAFLRYLRRRPGLLAKVRAVSPRRRRV